MKRYFWGVVLIGLGVVALLQGTGQELGLSFWPVVMTLAGLSIVYESIDSRRGPRWFGLALGIWIGAIGLFNILHDAGVSPDVDGGRIASAGWPILLIALGVSTFFGKGIRFTIERSHRRSWDPTGDSQHTVIGDMRYGRGPWRLDKDLNLSNSVGDLKLDLSTAEITPGTHRIAVTQFVGETVIKVPDNVTVRVTAEANVGELEILGDTRSGASLFIQREVVVPDSPVELIIDAHQRVGSLKVLRVPVPTRVIE